MDIHNQQSSSDVRDTIGYILSSPIENPVAVENAEEVQETSYSFPEFGPKKFKISCYTSTPKDVTEPAECSANLEQVRNENLNDHQKSLPNKYWTNHVSGMEDKEDANCCWDNEDNERNNTKVVPDAQTVQTGSEVELHQERSDTETGGTVTVQTDSEVELHQEKMETETGGTVTVQTGSEVELHQERSDTETGGTVTVQTGSEVELNQERNDTETGGTVRKQTGKLKTDKRLKERPDTVGYKQILRLRTNKPNYGFTPLAAPLILQRPKRKPTH